MSSANELSLIRAKRCLRIADYFQYPFLILVLAALYTIFVYAPTEQVMGEVQRIFYFHVGAAWNSFLAFFGVFLGGLLYLLTRQDFWDRVAVASAEIGVAFTTIVLVTGSIWARPVWNTWWPWGDPRVTTVLVLWLIYIAYLILRSSLPESDKKYKICAVYGIIGFLNVPIVWMSIRWWRTIHPKVITIEGIELDPRMTHALAISVLAFTMLYFALLNLRTAMRVHQNIAQAIRRDLTTANGRRG